jgi:multiple sugar transport system ATP-binding protein
MAEVIIRNVKKIYSGNVTAVHDFNLHIKDKEFIVFVGPSGCGKSTTLRMVAGLEDISEGTVSIDGEIVNDLQPKDRHISMVFQNYALYPHLTVYENMAFPLRLDKKIRKVPLSEEEKAKLEKELEKLEQDPNKNQAKIDKIKDQIENGKEQKGYTNDQIYQRVTDAAKVLGITQFLTRKPKAMSGGQRQRVAIGRAMVKDCKVFLMDEPLSNLDAKLRNQMRAEIILLRKRINTTFIYVTHDQTEAMTLGDRIVCMKDGFIMQVGTPTELFDMPANLFVAQFVCAPMMNTVNCDLIKEGDKYFVNPYGFKLPVDSAKAKALAERNIETRPIILGIRPEHIQLANGGASIPVTIQVNEMMGSEYHLHVTTDEGNRLIVRIPTLSLSDQEREKMVFGEKINITFSPKAMHFFDKENEKNLLVDITNADAYELDADIIHQEKQEELPKANKE